MTEIKNEALYQEGFNSGFFLKEREPKLFALVLSSTKGNSEYLTGLKDGGLEYEKSVQRQNQQDLDQSRDR